ncbi:hypothetical protein GCM10008023_36840 [Sphingomonas glacialis]|uniref:fructose-bisphosphate aldolase n=1 Tax=Sphingomonas glacialis TaxID=658225 RepID=A0ABQ3LT76_9SPHN|nr:hypothetical protein GCM10008023_36840 [Sphingomonas glacialis]
MTTPGLAQSIGTIILNEETIRQTELSGARFAATIRDAGIIPGVKVDTGTIALAGHARVRITDGVDWLKARLEAFAVMRARFAKWRGVITIAADIPTRGCIEADAQTLARYVAICRQVGLLTVIEPEVLIDGRHDLARCAVVTEEVLHAVFRHADEQGVALASR